DFTLVSPYEWGPFRYYYHGRRMQALRDVARRLQDLSPMEQAALPRDRIPGITPSWVLSCPICWLLNRFRSGWRFSEAEITFIISAFRAVIRLAESAVQPDPKDIVQLRMDLYVVEEIVEKKLTGVRSMSKARCIEHFYQADHLVSFSLEEILSGGSKWDAARK